MRLYSSLIQSAIPDPRSSIPDPRSPIPDPRSPILDPRLLTRPLHQALELLFAGQILRRPGLLPPAKLSRGPQRPVGITEVRPSQRNQVGTAGGDDRVDLIDVGDV